MGVNMELFCQITLNYKGSGSGSNRSVLRGFPGTKKEQTEPETGLFYPWKSTTLIGSWEYLSDDVVGVDLEIFHLVPDSRKKN
jgi:hypothetical protein